MDEIEMEDARSQLALLVEEIMEPCHQMFVQDKLAKLVKLVRGGMIEQARERDLRLRTEAEKQEDVRSLHDFLLRKTIEAAGCDSRSYPRKVLDEYDRFRALRHEQARDQEAKVPMTDMDELAARVAALELANASVTADRAKLEEVRETYRTYITSYNDDRAQDAAQEQLESLLLGDDAFESDTETEETLDRKTVKAFFNLPYGKKRGVAFRTFGAALYEDLSTLEWQKSICIRVREENKVALFKQCISEIGL